MSPGNILQLLQCHLLNRLDDGGHVCAIIDDLHFTTISSGREVLNHSAIIKKFMVQGAGGEQKFYAFPEPLKFPPHTVIVLTWEDSLCLNIYPNDPEYTAPGPSDRFLLLPIEPDREIDISVGQMIQEAQEILEKAMKRLDIIEAPLKYRPDLPKFQYSPAATRVLLGLDELMSPSKVASASPPPPAPPITMSVEGSSAKADKPVKGTTKPPAAHKDESLAEVMAILSDDKKPAAAQVKDGVAPKPPTLAVAPTLSAEASDAERKSSYVKYDLANKVSGLAGLFQAILKVKKMQADGRTTPYSITDPVTASLAFDENADFAWQVMTGGSVGGGLAGYYMLPGTSSGSFNQDVAKADFKLTFTQNLFEPYGLESDLETQISGAIQQYISAVAAIKLNSSDTTKTVSQFIPMNIVQHINISGNDDDKLMVWQPRVKFFYLHIDTEAYTESISTCFGSETTERFNFSMNYAVFQADVNWEEVQKNSDKLDKVFEILSNENLDAYVSEAGVISKVGQDNSPPGTTNPRVCLVRLIPRDLNLPMDLSIQHWRDKSPMELCAVRRMMRWNES